MVLISAGVLSVIAVCFLPFRPLMPILRPSQSAHGIHGDPARFDEGSGNLANYRGRSRPTPGAADALASRLASVSEVDKTLMLQSFIPDRQPEKLAVITDAGQLMDTTLNPFEVKLAPTVAEEKQSIGATKEMLRKIAARGTTQAFEAARRLADALRR